MFFVVCNLDHDGRFQRDEKRSKGVKLKHRLDIIDPVKDTESEKDDNKAKGKTRFNYV